MFLLRNLFRNSPFLKSIALISGGAAAGQCITIVAAPIITRLYSPTDFGSFAVYGSVISILIIIVSLRYELAVLIPCDDNEAFNIAFLAFCLICISSLALSSLLWFFQGAVVYWLKIPDIPFLPFFAMIALIGGGIYQVLTYWCLRQKNFAAIAMTKIHQGGGMIVIQVLLGSIHAGVIGLIAGDIVGRIAGVRKLGRPLLRRARQVTFDYSYFKRLALRYKRFPLFSCPATLINSLGTKLPAILLASLFGANVVGNFSLSQMVAGVPSLMIGQGISQVHLADVANLARTNPQWLRKRYIGLTKKLLLLSLIPGLVIGCYSPWAFAVIFGDEWREAGVYMQIQAGMFVIQFVVSSVTQHFNIIERQDVAFLWSLGRLVLTTTTLLAGFLWNFSARQTIGLFAISMSFAYIVCFVLGLHVLNPAALNSGLKVKSYK